MRPLFLGGKRIQVMSDTKEPHYHTDEKGFLVKCYHVTRIPWVSFCIGVTVSFPLEHFLYEKVWPFTLITAFLGL